MYVRIWRRNKLCWWRGVKWSDFVTKRVELILISIKSTTGNTVFEFFAIDQKSKSMIDRFLTKAKFSPRCGFENTNSISTYLYKSKIIIRTWINVILIKMGACLYHNGTRTIPQNQRGKIFFWINFGKDFKFNNIF